jgi:AcrR family transcriptional regulator
MVTSSSNTHAAIFEAATRLMLEQGEGGLRVDAVAAAAGCNKRLIYHYFGSRDRLVAAVYQQQCRVLCSQENGLSEPTRHILHQQLQGLWPELEPWLDSDAQWANAKPDSIDLQLALKSALVLVLPSLLRAIFGAKTESLANSYSPGEWQKLSTELVAVMFGAEMPLHVDESEKVSKRSQTISKPRYRMASASRVVD